MKSHLLLLALVATPALAGGAPKEVEVKPSALPAAVTKAIEARFPGAKVEKAEMEGKTYEVEILTADGKRMEVDLNKKGKIGEVSERKAEAAPKAPGKAPLSVETDDDDDTPFEHDGGNDDDDEDEAGDDDGDGEHDVETGPIDPEDD